MNVPQAGLRPGGLRVAAASVELYLGEGRHLFPLRGVCIQCSRSAGCIHEGGVCALALHGGSYFRLLHDFLQPQDWLARQL